MYTTCYTIQTMNYFHFYMYGSLVTQRQFAKPVHTNIYKVQVFIAIIEYLNEKIQTGGFETMSKNYYILFFPNLTEDWNYNQAKVLSQDLTIN